MFVTIGIHWREGFLGGVRKCYGCVDSISEQCFSDWVLKVSVLETGHTRYCSISGSDPLRQSYRLCHGYCRKTPTTNNQLWTVHLNGSMQLNILDRWKFYYWSHFQVCYYSIFIHVGNIISKIYMSICQIIILSLRYCSNRLYII